MSKRITFGVRVTVRVRFRGMGYNVRARIRIEMRGKGIKLEAKSDVCWTQKEKRSEI